MFEEINIFQKIKDTLRLMLENFYVYLNILKIKFQST
jgi:hypothetical protein